MLPDSCSILLFLLMFRMSNGDSVTQTEGLVTVTEGSPVMLNCTYQTTDSAPYVFWYVQYLNKAPQLLLKGFTDKKRTEYQGFYATLHKSNSSFHLQKPSVQLSDSALYYCALSDTVKETAGEAAHKPRVQEGEGSGPVRESCVLGRSKKSIRFLEAGVTGSCLSQGEQVEQRPSMLRVQEGARAVINCTYVDSTSYYFPWYKQEPGKHPKLIIDIRPNVERKQDQRLIISHDKKTKQFSLHITDTQPGDSAMYFCAASAHCSPGTCSLF
ncbi:uncharacterized protein LOC130884701 [Chionomys nivalis]|uniref:uncharacterized protein LOC130884701 n=1 Tax=Chionomys nivalis TaxID=269649 RepID=UPI002597A175|nr:uncharacterized protein LOC130884701 [Chionomys nivalis]